MTCGDKRSLVNEIRKVGTGKAGRAPSDHVDLYAFIKRDLPRMDLEDTFAAANIRVRNNDLPVETVPGGVSAGSSTSGLFVDAIRMTPSFDSNPSISTNS